jgi:Flp pilus assembly protein TadD
MDLLSAQPTAPVNRRTLTVLALVLFLGTIAVYGTALRNGFVNFDDPDYVTANAYVLQGLNWHNVLWSFGTDNPAANWHPLTWMSHMLDVSVYGTRPAGHHLTNILLHGIDVVLLFLVLALGTGFAGRSAAAATIFAVHPLNVEAVAWIAERKSVLCLLFFFLAILAYGWYARKPSAMKYVCVFVLYAVALLSKIMVITLPAALLLLDFWPLHRISLSSTVGKLRTFALLLLEKVPLFLLSFAAAYVTLSIHRKEGALAAAMPLRWRLENTLYSYAMYLWKAVWPSRLAAFYPHPEDALSIGVLVASALALLAISATVCRFRRKEYLVVGWLWFLGTMVPMSGIVQSGRQGMADRYMYIPMIGLIVGVTWAAGEFIKRMHWNPQAAAAITLLVAAPCIFGAERQIGYWKDSVTLFTHTIQVTGPNGMAENDLGSALVDRGLVDLALPHFEDAVRYSPDLAAAHYNLGFALQLKNRTAEAASEYRAAIALFQDPMEAARAHNNLGVLYQNQQDAASALREFDKAISLNPAEQNSYVGRGRIELQSFQFDAAIADFARAVNLGPSATACFWLGRALETKGDDANAAKAYAEALRLAPRMAEARERLSALQAKLGR